LHLHLALIFRRLQILDLDIMYVIPKLILYFNYHFARTDVR